MSGYDEHRSACVFAGVVYGWLSCLAFVLLCGGCWRTTDTPPVSAGPTYVIRKGNAAERTCEKLTTIAGEIPMGVDFAGCADRDGDDYWYCRSLKLDEHNWTLQRWITTALALCSP